MSETATVPVHITKGPPIYDHIPVLYHKKDPCLLPKTGGIPGFQYAQISTSCRKRAQDEGWLPVDNSWTYTIVGPNGSIDMDLFCRGRRILGQSHDAGRRVMVVDTAVQEATGHWINPQNHMEPADAEESKQQVAQASGVPTEQRKSPQRGPTNQPQK